MRFHRAALVAGLIGVGVPLVLEAIWQFTNRHPDLGCDLALQEATLVLWPTSIILIAADNMNRAAQIEALLISIAANVVLYVALGSLIWRVYWTLSRTRRAS